MATMKKMTLIVFVLLLISKLGYVSWKSIKHKKEISVLVELIMQEDPEVSEWCSAMGEGRARIVGVGGTNLDLEDGVAISKDWINIERITENGHVTTNQYVFSFQKCDGNGNVITNFRSRAYANVLRLLKEVGMHE